MSILTRYIAAAYLRVFGLCISSFVVLYLVIDFLEKIGRFSRFQPPPLAVAQFFLLKVPEIVTQVIPLAVLMSTLLTLGMLSRNSEITAMRSCGVSLQKISKPILVTACAASIFTIVSNELILPETYQKMRYTEEVLIRKMNHNTFFRQNNIWFKDENAILQARLFDPDHQTLAGVTLWNLSGGMRPQKRIDAEKATWDTKGWTLQKITVRDMREGSVATTTKLDTMPVPLRLKIDDLKVVDKYADNMGFFKLRSYIDKLRKGGYVTTRFEAQMHARVSLPFASLIMAFLGIPFALRGGRSSGVALGIGASIAIGFSYFIINSMLLSFGQTGLLPPFVAAWAANVIFSLAGIWLAMTMNN